MLADAVFFILYINAEGHTTVDCPHRAAMEFGVIPASRKRTNNSLDYVFERQMRPRVPSVSFLFEEFISFH